jgi:hypothetical protein
MDLIDELGTLSGVPALRGATKVDIFSDVHLAATELVPA